MLPSRRPASAPPRVAMLVGALAIAACTSDDGSAQGAAATRSEATSTTSTTSTTSAPPATAAPSAPATAAPPTTVDAAGSDELVELARSALIDLTVFPAGWIERPAETGDAGTAELGDEVDTCLGRDGERASDALTGREASSSDFAGPAETRRTVSQEIKLADDEATAIAVMDDLAVEGAAACLAATLQTYLERQTAADIEQRGVTLGTIGVTRIDGAAPAAREVAYRVEIPLEVERQTFVQYLDVLYQRAGRALSRVQFGSFGAPFDPELHATIAAAVAERLSTVAG